MMREGVVLNLRRRASEYRWPQVHPGAECEWPTTLGKQIPTEPAPEHRAHVLLRLGIEARDADEAWLHACQVVDENAHAGCSFLVMMAARAIDARSRCRPTPVAGTP